jgi:transposase-like protein
MFKISVSYQTVLNYAKATAYHCHKFNLYYKGEIDDKAVGDETYLKIKGKQHYLFLFISAIRKSITAYHLADNRGAIPAIAAINEAIKTAGDEQDITCISDGNPAYPAAIHFLNENRKKEKLKKIEHKKVIGLQNLDQESTEYREFKQIIERLNRTYKFHLRATAGFNSFNGAMALTTLFVSYYNFLRPHSALGHKTPIYVYDLQRKNDTIQTKWIKMLKLAAELPDIGESMIKLDCRVAHQE